LALQPPPSWLPLAAGSPPGFPLGGGQGHRPLSFWGADRVHQMVLLVLSTMRTNVGLRRVLNN
jgi:hypothetical protein